MGTFLLAAGPGILQQFDCFPVCQVSPVFIYLSYRSESLGRFEYYHLVNQRGYLPGCLNTGHGRSHYDPACLSISAQLYGRPHCAAHGYSIIDQYDRQPFDRLEFSAMPEQSNQTSNLDYLAFLYLFDSFGLDVSCRSRQDHGASVFRHGPEAGFRIIWERQFPDHHDIQRQLKVSSYLVSDCHPAPRNSQHYAVVASELYQSGRKYLAGFLSIFEHIAPTTSMPPLSQTSPGLSTCPCCGKCPFFPGKMHGNELRTLL
jgi:hypothetical protein